MSSNPPSAPAPGAARVHFVSAQLAARWPDLGTIAGVEAVAERFRSGVDIWIVQTFLELRDRCRAHGFEVVAAARFPRDEPAVAHRDDLKARACYYRSYLADTRADRQEVLGAAWHIVQNPAQAGPRSVFVPHWPQPGLIARDPLRQGVTQLGFFGRLGSVPGFFSDPDFCAELARRGIDFALSERNWRDYSRTDVCVALRFDPPLGASAKPFSKLVNAWLAGVPALLGPESAYRWLRRSELDYIEVRSGRDILAALDRLRADAALYRAMVDNGRRRARDFDRDAVRASWLSFMTDTFLPAWREWRAARPSGISRAVRYAIDLAAQRRLRVEYKSIEARQAREIAERGEGRTFS